MTEKNNDSITLNNLEEKNEDVATKVEQTDSVILENHSEKKLVGDKINFTTMEVDTTLDDYLEISSNFYAGFWQRLLAYIIDLIIVACLGRLLNTATLGNINLNIEIVWLDNSLTFLIAYFLYFIFMTYFLAQTLGKIIVGIRVEKKEGGKLTFADVIFRELVGRFFSDIFAMLPYVAVAFTPKKKALHDYIADSVVIKEDFSNLRNKLNRILQSK